MKPGARNVEKKGITFIKEMPIHYSNLALVDPSTRYDVVSFFFYSVVVFSSSSTLLEIYLWYTSV